MSEVRDIYVRAETHTPFGSSLQVHHFHFERNNPCAFQGDLKMDVEDFEDDKFQEAMAGVLGVQAADVKITSVSSGSTLIKFHVASGKITDPKRVNAAENTTSLFGAAFSCKVDEEQTRLLIEYSRRAALKQPIAQLTYKPHQQLISNVSESGLTVFQASGSPNRSKGSKKMFSKPALATRTPEERAHLAERHGERLSNSFAELRLALEAANNAALGTRPSIAAGPGILPTSL